MALPTIADIARVTADTEIRYTQSGKAVAQTRLAFNKSKFNEQTRQWENDKTFFIDGTTWEDAAERASQQLLKGAEVYVTGEIETQQWEKDGEKRSKPSLTIRRFKVIPKVEQPQGTQGGGYSGAQQGPPQSGYGPLQADPWAGGGNQGGGFDPDQVPF